MPHHVLITLTTMLAFCFASPLSAEPERTREVEYQANGSSYTLPSGLREAMSIRGVSVGMTRDEVKKAISSLGGSTAGADGGRISDGYPKNTIYQSLDRVQYTIKFPNYPASLNVDVRQKDFWEGFTVYFTPPSAGGLAYAVEWRMSTRTNPRIDGTDFIATIMGRFPAAPEDQNDEAEYRSRNYPREFRWAFDGSGKSARSEACQNVFGEVGKAQSVKAPIFKYGAGSFSEISALGSVGLSCGNVGYLYVSGGDNSVNEMRYSVVSLYLMLESLNKDMRIVATSFGQMATEYSAWKKSTKLPSP